MHKRPPRRRAHLTLTEETERSAQKSRAAKRRVPRPRGNRRPRSWNRTLKLVALCLFLGEAGALLFANPYFRVAGVRVNGAKTLTAQQVFDDAQVPNRANIFTLLRQPFAKRLEANPVVDHASSTIRLPHTLVLTVTERTPRAVLAGGGRFWLVDPKGVPYQELDAPQPGLPLIAVAASVLPSDIPLGRPLHAVWLGDAYKVLGLLQNAPDLGGAKITVDQNLNLCLNRRDQLQIRLGQPDSLPWKLQLADAAVSAYGGALARRAAYIDVSCPQQPVWKPRADRKNSSNTHGSQNGPEPQAD